MKYKTRSEMLAKEKVGKLLYNLSLPAITGMLVQALYNTVDTIFVGKGVGTIGIGAVSIVFPIQMLVFAVGQTVGIGGGSRISRRMGAGDIEEAGLTLGNMTLLSLSLGGLILIGGLLAMIPLLCLFGTTEAMMPYSKDYLSVILLSSPIATFVMATNNAVRAEGNAKVAMVTMIIGAFLNMLLDPLFIFVFHMGVRGAAWATNISMTFTSLFLVLYFTTGRSEIPLQAHYFRFKKAIVAEIISVGSSSFARSGAMSLSMAILNNVLRIHGGDVAIAVFGVIFRLLTFIIMPLMGLTQGLLPIVGFNYGARLFNRLRQAVVTATTTSIAVATIGFVICFLFPEEIMRIFSNDPELVQAGQHALRRIIIFLPLAGYQIIGGGIFQALGRSLPALFLSLIRQVIALIPMILVLPRLFGLDGIWYSFPVADAVSFTFTFVMVYWTMKGLPRDMPVGVLPKEPVAEQKIG